MDIASPPTERQLIEQYVEALRSLPDVHPDPPRWEAIASEPNQRCDARVDLAVAGKAFTLIIEAKKSVYPRDVHQVLGQQRQSTRDHSLGPASNDRISIIVAEAISPGAKDLLRSERVGYYDRGGSLFLPVSGAYVYIDRPPPKTLAKSMRSLFSGRRAQILHALLVRPRNWFNGKEVADEAHVSQATASEVLTELERFDWVTSRGQGPGKERHLKDPAALLNAWVKQFETARAPALRRFYVPSLKADQLLEPIGRVFGHHKVDYEISYEAAAQCYAPFLSAISQIRCRLIPGPAVDSALSDLDARVVTEGLNFVVIEAKSSEELLFREHIAGAWLASPVQVYLDLQRGEGRAKEMAEHLRKERIGF
jgi:hypothetical protein